MAQPISLTDCAVERERIADLEAALRSVIRAWTDPGDMGTMYVMPRAVSHAKSVLDGPSAA
jgi:hypothetical protein